MTSNYENGNTWVLKVKNPKEIWNNGNSVNYCHAKTHFMDRFDQEGVTRFMDSSYLDNYRNHHISLEEDEVDAKYASRALEYQLINDTKIAEANGWLNAEVFTLMAFNNRILQISAETAANNLKLSEYLEKLKMNILSRENML